MRNSMFGGSRRVSMEAIMDEGREPVPVVEETAIDVALRPDPALIESETALVEAGEEMSDRESDVAELQEAAEHLEVVRQNLEESLEENGLDRVGARVAVHSVGRALSRIGTGIDVPSTEAYGSASNRVHATRLTMEAIGDKIKEIWEAIKVAWAKAWDATKKFFASIFDRVTQIRNQAEKVKAAAPQATGTPSVKTVTAKGAGNRLAANGKVDNGWAAIVTGALNGAKGSLDQVGQLADFFDGIAADMKAGKADETAVAGSLENYLKTLGIVANVFKGIGGRALPSANIPGIDNSKSNVVLSPVLPGNALFYVATAKASGSLAEVVGASKAGFIQLGASSDVSDEFPIMDPDSMETLADAVISACDSIDEHKAAIEKLTEAGSQLVAAGDALVASKTGDEADAATAVIQALPRMQEHVASWPKQLTSYLLSIGGAGLSVATATLAAYKGAAAPEGSKALPAPEAAPAA